MCLVDIQELVDANPWWKTPVAIKEDASIVEMSRAPVKWHPKVSESFVMNKDRVYTMRGPRQVGKTTLLKLLMRDLLSKTGEPRAVFYYSCDAIGTFKDLVQLIRIYLDFSSDIDSERRYLFIDEVSAVREWERGIKILRDAGDLMNVTAILTGSHSMDLKYSAERLPGRRGEGEEPVNKLLLPMRFSEYVFTVRPDIHGQLRRFPSFDERARILRGLFEGKIHPTISRDLVLYSKELKQLLDNYLLTGGIVRPVCEFHGKLRKNPRISSSTYELYIRSLTGDLARWRYQEKIAKQVVRSVIEKMTTRISANSVAKEIEVSHHTVASRYLGALEDSFVLRVLYPLSLHDRRASYTRQIKVYLSDPFLYHAAKGWVSGAVDYFRRSEDALLDPVEKSRLIEMVVANHLVQWSYDAAPSDIFSPHERLFFFRKKRSEREVDFVLRHGDELYPYEVKYKESVDTRDLNGLFSFHKGVLVSKHDLEARRSYTTIPVEMLLMLL